MDVTSDWHSHMCLCVRVILFGLIVDKDVGDRKGCAHEWYSDSDNYHLQTKILPLWNGLTLAPHHPMSVSDHASCTHTYLPATSRNHREWEEFFPASRRHSIQGRISLKDTPLDRGGPILRALTTSTPLFIDQHALWSSFRVPDPTANRGQLLLPNPYRLYRFQDFRSPAWCCSVRCWYSVHQRIRASHEYWTVQYWSALPCSLWLMKINCDQGDGKKGGGGWEKSHILIVLDFHNSTPFSWISRWHRRLFSRLRSGSAISRFFIYYMKHVLQSNWLQKRQVIRFSSSKLGGQSSTVIWWS